MRPPKFLENLKISFVPPPNFQSRFAYEYTSLQKQIKKFNYPTAHILYSTLSRHCIVVVIL